MPFFSNTCYYIVSFKIQPRVSRDTYVRLNRAGRKALIGKKKNMEKNSEL